jgi:hypothetical protein
MPEPDPATDLFDLKMLPAWATETPNDNRYADFAGEEEGRGGARDRRGGGGGGGDRRDRGPRPPRRNEPRREGREGGGNRERDRGPQSRNVRPSEPRRTEEAWTPPPRVEVRFLPDKRALENVLLQIKGGHLAYSVFSLARMFLEKPERYDVRLTAQDSPLYQMGENGAVASDRKLLENGAFARELENFYRVEVTQTEPIKGNFTSVGRDRASGVLLGPTNHHGYQTKLRALYEQRYSRRMSFPDFQRQIEIVNDPEVVDRWKEEARSLTTYTTLQEEPPQTFNSTAETERHFRQNYLAGLFRENKEVVVDGVVSRQLPDRALGRLIENAWAQESRSPSKMMQELIAAFPDLGLHIFRHRKGMLFVAPVRPKPFGHDTARVSTSIASLMRTLADAPGINRKQLLEKMLSGAEGETSPDEVEKKKRTIASDLHWLIAEGHVIEFNDGSLDLSRVKSSAGKTATPAASIAPQKMTEDESAPVIVAEDAPAPVVAPEPEGAGDQEKSEPIVTEAEPEADGTSTSLPNEQSIDDPGPGARPAETGARS